MERLEQLLGDRTRYSPTPGTPNYRPHLLLYYKWKHRLEPIWRTIKCIAAFSFHLLFGASAGTLIFHTVVCAFYKQDFRHFCGNTETDITVSISGGIFGMIGAYYLKKLQIFQRCSCLCIGDPYSDL